MTHFSKTRGRGIHFPRLYDFIMFALTKGHRDAYRRAVLDAVKIRSGDSVLDVGCGTGDQAILAKQMSGPSGTVVGVDISADMLAVARRKARASHVDVSFLCADAAHLPAEAERFDVVMLVTVMHMVPEADRTACLAEASRVLKPRGRLLVVDYAGEVRSRRSVVSRHKLHGAFDLDRTTPSLAEHNLNVLQRDSLGWLDLHFVLAIKPELTGNASSYLGTSVAKGDGKSLAI
jgi:SAM-dependent methyltransferase